MTDVVGEQVEAIFISFQSSGGNIKTGKLRPLAITSLTRSPTAPEIPTLAEFGYPNFQLTSWYALTGPKGVIQDVVAILNREAKAAVAAPDFRERITSAATDPVGSSPAQAPGFITDEVAKWGSVVK